MESREGGANETIPLKFAVSLLASGLKKTRIIDLAFIILPILSIFSILYQEVRQQQQMMCPLEVFR